MTELAELEPTPTRIPQSAESSTGMQYARAFAGLFVRDLHVLMRIHAHLRSQDEITYQNMEIAHK